MERNTLQERNAFVEHFLEVNMFNVTEKKLESVKSDVHRKVILINEESTKRNMRKNKQPLNLKSKFRSNPLVKVNACSYSDCKVLNQLWNQYIDQLLHADKRQSTKLIQELLLKADFHGAEVKVVRSKCKSLVHIQGIVITETQNVFNIITKNNKIVKIPKRNSIFEIIFCEYKITIFGDQFCMKPGFRLVKKFNKYLSRLPLV